MANNNIQVSVIMPMHNVEEYIKDSITSVLNQTMIQFELIIIDDHSSDQSYGIASTYVGQDERVVLLKLTDAYGVSAARNLGLLMAKGKYIFFLDADDLISQDALGILLATATREQADLIIGHHEMFNSKTRELAWIYKEFPSLNIPGAKDIINNYDLVQLPYCWGKLYSRQLLNENIFSENVSFGEDQIFTIHAYLNAKKIYMVDSLLYQYRSREGQITKSTYIQPEKYVADMIQVFNMVEGHIYNWNENDSAKSELYAYYLNSYLLRNLFSVLASGLLSDNVSMQRSVLNRYKEWVLNLKPTIFKETRQSLEDINYRIEKMISIFDNEIQNLYKELFEIVNRMTMRNAVDPIHDEFFEMKKKAPLITIRTLAYNVEKYIEACIESVLNQSFTNFEWVILDNGSTDRTGEIIKEYALRDNRIKVYKNEKNSMLFNQKHHPEFVAHFEHLQSEYWCVLDSDDCLHPDFLQELYTAAKENNADVAVGGTEKFYEEDAQPREVRVCPEFYTNDITRLGDIFPSVYFLFSVYWGKLIKVSVLLELQEFRKQHSRYLKHADDTMFCLDLLKFSKSVVGVNKVLHYYRIRPNSYYHAQIDKDRYSDYVRLYQESKKLLQSWNQLSEQNFNFIIEKMYFSIINCLVLISKSEKICIEEKLESIELILSDEIIFEAFTERGIIANLFDETQVAMNTIYQNMNSLDISKALTHYVYRLFTSINRINSSDSNIQNVLLLYLSSICDEKNTTRFGSMFFYAFFSACKKEQFSQFEKSGISCEFIVSDPILLREIVNSRFDLAIEISKKRTDHVEYKLLTKILEQACSRVNFETVENEKYLVSQYLHSKNFDDAIDLLVNILEQCPLDKEALCYKLQLLIEDGDLFTAIETAEVLNIFYPDDNIISELVEYTFLIAGLKDQKELQTSKE
ncbi:glycosyltransferase involved in cell wall biosynthesis [Paenibacillus sp. 1182]|uniref:glycosyltransferase family 2 protein n=1 Tax=Paenibacillus sp. 1182 TaxID=2806565 RepID=UPI001AE5D0C2|nr:glycosyltransferase family 2 protein [Paenibacillus sp. 1182]MBP1308055.1 glycosyltransferase involved in cell wall biosynthesis [Paenibacillus sp. 1182]